MGQVLCYYYFPLWGETPHSVPPKQTIVPRLHCVEISAAFEKRHTHTHTGNLGTEKKNCWTVRCCWQHYSCERHGRLALKARRMPLLSPWPSLHTSWRKLSFKQFDVYGLSLQCSKCTRWPVEDPNRKASRTPLSSERNRALWPSSPPSESPRDDCSVIFL